MTTRHTISRADKLYAGSAKKAGDTSTTAGGRDRDGWGIEIPHIYVMEYGAIETADADGMICSVVATGLNNVNLVPYATGALITSSIVATAVGATVLINPTARNIVFTCSIANPILNVVGRDMYGETMVERIKCTAAGGYSSGFKAFKYIDNLYVTADATTISCGTGNRIGLPYHLSSLGRFLGLHVDGRTTASVSIGATSFGIATGFTASNTHTSSEDAPDVRGTLQLGLDALTTPNATKVFTAVMLIDRTGGIKTYGANQAAAIT